MTGTLGTSYVRTFLPYLVGYLVSVLARHGLDINDDNAAALITLVVGSAYYAVVRFLEVFAGPKWGYVLGVAKSPGYAPGSPPQDEPLGSETGSVELRIAVAVVLMVVGLAVIFGGHVALGALVLLLGLAVFCFT